MAGGQRTRHTLRALPIVVAAAIAALGFAPDPASLARVRSSRKPPIEQQIGLRPGLQLAAMRAAITAAPSFYPNFNSGCPRTLPVIALVGGQVMAGNFRDQDGGCYVWLNLAHAPLLTAQEICKLALHEMGHLTGLQHSQDPKDVMYSPFESSPIPPPCVKPLPASS